MDHPQRKVPGPTEEHLASCIKMSIGLWSSQKCMMPKSKVGAIRTGRHFPRWPTWRWEYAVSPKLCAIESQFCCQIVGFGGPGVQWTHFRGNKVRIFPCFILMEQNNSAYFAKK